MLDAEGKNERSKINCALHLANSKHNSDREKESEEKKGVWDVFIVRHCRRNRSLRSQVTSSAPVSFRDMSSNSRGRKPQ